MTNTIGDALDRALDVLAEKRGIVANRYLMDDLLDYSDLRLEELVQLLNDLSAAE